jgi:two-component system cell cycle response regulator DivK
MNCMGTPLLCEQAEFKSAPMILIVEDNKTNMMLFQDLVDNLGYQSIGTDEPEEVMELIRMCQPDMILMDIQLPRISGIELTRAIKTDSEMRRIPVIAITAFATCAREDIQDSGCDAIIAKPISISAFMKTVQEFAEHSTG